MKRTGIIAVVVIVIAIVAGGFLLTANNSNPNSNSSSGASANAAVAATITYNGSNFSPSSVTVKSGSTVSVKNTSGSPVEYDSDPHPIHTDDTDLNVGEVAPGQSKSFTVHKTGSFGYHNHLNPSQTGKITIQ